LSVATIPNCTFQFVANTGNAEAGSVETPN
jgi:hypothetical protein